MSDTVENNLSMMVENDGNGDQCGMSYKLRCDAVRTYNPERFARACLLMVTQCNAWMVSRGYQSVTARELLEQAIIVQDDLVSHIADCAA